MLLGVELGRDLLARAAGAGAGGIARLGHEAVDDAVEDHAVVEALPSQFLDLRHVLGRDVGTHLDDHAAFRHVHVEGVLQISGAHARSSKDEGGCERGAARQEAHASDPPGLQGRGP